MIQWIALFFATATLQAPPTSYHIPTTLQVLDFDSNAYDFVQSTASIANYMLALRQPPWVLLPAGITGEYVKKAYQATEQTVVKNSTGGIQVIARKFLAKPQNLITSVGIEWPGIGVSITSMSIVDLNIGMTKRWEHFAIGPDKSMVALYAIKKCQLAPELGYRLYSAREYAWRERYDFAFRFK